MSAIRLCRKEEASKLYDYIAFSGDVSSFASKEVYKKQRGDGLEATISNLLGSTATRLFLFVLDNERIDGYALCGIRPSALDGPKDKADCLFIDEMSIGVTAKEKRAEAEFQAAISKYCEENNLSLVLTLEALQGSMKKYYSSQFPPDKSANND